MDKNLNKHFTKENIQKADKYICHYITELIWQLDSSTYLLKWLKPKHTKCWWLCMPQKLSSAAGGNTKWYNLIVIAKMWYYVKCLKGGCIQTNGAPYNGVLFSTKNKWGIKPWKFMKETLKAHC